MPKQEPPAGRHQQVGVDSDEKFDVLHQELLMLEKSERLVGSDVADRMCASANGASPIKS